MPLSGDPDLFVVGAFFDRSVGVLRCANAWRARDRLIILGRGLTTCALCKFADSIKAQRTPAQIPTGYQTKKKTEKSGTSILALRLEHLVPLFSAPQTVHALCVHLGGQQLVAFLFFLSSTLVLDSLDFSLQESVRKMQQP